MLTTQRFASNLLCCANARARGLSELNKVIVLTNSSNELERQPGTGGSGLCNSNIGIGVEVRFGVWVNPESEVGSG